MLDIGELEMIIEKLYLKAGLSIVVVVHSRFELIIIVINRKGL
jgi:hypothetical protein